MDFVSAFDPIRALGSSGRLIRRAPLTLLFGGILLTLTDPASNEGWRWRISADDEFEWLIAGGLTCLGCLLFLVAFAINGLVQVGLAAAVQRVMLTGEEQFKDLFRDRGLWLNMILTRIMKSLIMLVSVLPAAFLAGGPIFIGHLFDLYELGVVAGVALVLAYVPIVIYVMLGLLLMEQAVAIEGKLPFEALERSWEIARGNRIQLFGYALLLGIVSLVGVCACCVGYFFTSAWAWVAWNESYLRLTQSVPPEGLWVDRG